MSAPYKAITAARIIGVSVPTLHAHRSRLARKRIRCGLLDDSGPGKAAWWFDDDDLLLLQRSIHNTKRGPQPKVATNG